MELAPDWLLADPLAVECLAMGLGIELAADVAFEAARLMAMGVPREEAERHAMGG